MRSCMDYSRMRRTQSRVRDSFGRRSGNLYPLTDRVTLCDWNINCEQLKRVVVVLLSVLLATASLRTTDASASYEDSI